MKIKSLYSSEEQECQIGNHFWSVSRLFELSKNLIVFEIPINHLNIWYKYTEISLREMIMHINAVNNADLSFPIILDEDGEIMDGRHRIMKAIIKGEKTIKAVRFDENPTPCKIKK